jgi:phosphoribosylcarboxyaminoimidazole (NCAIR) mutase
MDSARDAVHGSGDGRKLPSISAGEKDVGFSCSFVIVRQLHSAKDTLSSATMPQSIPVDTFGLLLSSSVTC